MNKNYYCSNFSDAMNVFSSSNIKGKTRICDFSYLVKSSVTGSLKCDEHRHFIHTLIHGYTTGLISLQCTWQQFWAACSRRNIQNSNYSFFIANQIVKKQVNMLLESDKWNFMIVSFCVSLQPCGLINHTSR